MKKLTLLIGLFLVSFSYHIKASEVVKTSVVGLMPTELEYAVEIKTDKFDKVVLDCQSLRMGISFESKGEIYSDIYLNEMMCGEVMEFVVTSMQDGLPVCIGVDKDYQELYLSRESDSCF